eukprot:6338163-Alexandrium_andersonii.AAC.1
MFHHPVSGGPECIATNAHNRCSAALSCLNYRMQENAVQLLALRDIVSLWLKASRSAQDCLKPPESDHETAKSCAMQL